MSSSPEKLIFVTNRGPVTVSPSQPGPVLRQAGGGLASAMLGLLSEQPTVFWSFPISTDLEKTAHQEGLFTQFHAGLVPIEIAPEIYNIAYNTVSNQLLWFLFHGIFDLSRRPSFDSAFRVAFRAYQSFNLSMAQALLAQSDVADRIVVNDYHLLLACHYIKEASPVTQVSFFLHTPFPYPAEFAVLPKDIALELLKGINAADRVGFHCRTWEKNFQDTCRLQGITPTTTFVAPLPPDATGLLKRASGADVMATKERLTAWQQGLPLILRVDRLEPSKNIVRSASAIAEMLRNAPEMREQFRALFLCYASRADLPEYQEVAREVAEAIEAVNTEFGTSTWEPITLDLEDNPSRSLAAYQIFDVLLVNPVRDGLNLVAAEGALLAKPGATIVLSETAGLYPHVADWVTQVSPWDISATASALAGGLKSAGSTGGLRNWVESLSFAGWINALCG